MSREKKFAIAIMEGMKSAGEPWLDIRLKNNNNNSLHVLKREVLDNEYRKVVTESNCHHYCPHVTLNKTIHLFHSLKITETYFWKCINMHISM